MLTHTFRVASSCYSIIPGPYSVTFCFVILKNYRNHVYFVRGNGSIWFGLTTCQKSYINLTDNLEMVQRIFFAPRSHK
uniref:Uncharacterized protein n=1 Tax=Pararge aegeria TaxID=116150 RepID=S4P1H6_9NEOP